MTTRFTPKDVKISPRLVLCTPGRLPGHRVKTRMSHDAWESCDDSLRTLHKEILEFSECCRPSENRAAVIRRIVSEVEFCARQHGISDAEVRPPAICAPEDPYKHTDFRRVLCVHVQAHLFGSQAVNMATPESDVDLVLLSPRGLLGDSTKNMQIKQENIRFMYDIAESICPRPFSSAEVIASAFVPIIKCATKVCQMLNWNQGNALQGRQTPCRCETRACEHVAHMQCM
jgi:hypothetical protein